jgi:hypothetical protein
MDYLLILLKKSKMESYKLKWPINHFFTTIDHLELDRQDFYNFRNTIVLFFVKVLAFS